MSPLDELKAKVERKGESGVNIADLGDDQLKELLDTGGYVVKVAKMHGYTPIVRVYLEKFAPK